jgi:hypothetical protein
MFIPLVMIRSGLHEFHVASLVVLSEMVAPPASCGVPFVGVTPRASPAFVRYAQGDDKFRESICRLDLFRIVGAGTSASTS